MATVTRRVHTQNCKNCGTEYQLTGDTVETDAARGLSATTRCPNCKERHRSFLNATGVGYVDMSQFKVSTPDPECIGKYGLGFLVHPDRNIRVTELESGPKPEVMEKFSILQPAVDALIKNLEDPNGTQVSILVGPTGTGKSVWAPSQIYLSSIGREGRICVTQPRLTTLRAGKDGDSATTPGFVATQLLGQDGIGAGQEIGLLYGGESTKQDRSTRLLYITDGILIRWILTGQLGRFTVLMIDEAHEQSANMELIFALLRYHLPLYPRLRLVIMSATVDTEKFRKFFGYGDPKRVFIAQPNEPTTLCKIHDRWPEGPDGYRKLLPGFSLPEKPADSVAASAALVKAIRTVPNFTKLNKPNGDILIFMPTIPLVDRCVEAVKKLALSGMDVFPYHAQLEDAEVSAFTKAEEKAKEAMDAKSPTNPQRVIVATNYAETSVTLANLRYVIDNGYILEPTWNPSTCGTEYVVRKHSQAGCTQRKGRVGRKLDGEVFRLYTEADFKNPKIFRPTPSAAIARESLEKFLLSAKAAGIADLESFRWLGYDDDDERQVQERKRSLRMLSRYGVVDSEGDVTNRGLELEGLRSGSLGWSMAMSHSDAFGCSLEVSTFLAFTSQMKEPLLDSDEGLLAFERWRTGCADDLEFYLRLFHHWEKAKNPEKPEAHAMWAKSEGFNHAVLKDINSSRKEGLKQFAQRTHTEMWKRQLDVTRLHRIRLLLAQNLAEWIYVRDKRYEGPGTRYTPLNPGNCPCKDPVYIERGSSCSDRPIDAMLCAERQQIKDRVFARHIVLVDPVWTAELAKVKTDTDLALLFRKYVEKDAKDRPGGAENSVLKKAEPAANLKRYNAGALLRFEVIRERRAKDRTIPSTLLVRDVEKKIPLLVSMEGSRVSPGQIFRAHVEGIIPKRPVLNVTQKRIIASDYPVGKKFKRSALREVKRLCGEGEDVPYGIIYELEPGIQAKCSRSRNPVFAFWWERFLAGEVDELIIGKHVDGNILLNMLFPPPAEGERLSGFVSDFILDKRRNNARIGIKVRFLPHLMGVVWGRTLEGDTNIDDFEPDDRVDVVVERITEKDGYQRFDLKLVGRKSRHSGDGSQIVREKAGDNNRGYGPLPDDDDSSGAGGYSGYGGYGGGRRY